MAVFLAACRSSGPEPASGPAVVGRVDYRQFELLPRPALLEVWLLQTSQSDQGQQVLAEWVQADPGQVPIAFDLRYDPERVDPAHAYTIRARISSDERLLFMTTELVGVELWEEVEALASEAERRAEELASGTDEPAGIQAEEPGLPSLDVGRIMLTKVPGAPPPLPARATVRGRLRTAGDEPLPEEGSIHVELVAAATADAPEELLAEWVSAERLSIPVEFELAYSPADVRPQRSYTVRARVLRDDVRLYLTRSVNAVDLAREVEHLRTGSDAGVPDETRVLDVGAILLTRIPGAAPPVAPATGAVPARAYVSGFVDTVGQRSLPADTLVRVRLVSTPRQGTTEETIAEWSGSGPAEIPLAFELEYDPAVVDELHRTTLRAEITRGDERLFLTTGLYPVNLWAEVQRMRRAEADTTRQVLETGRLLLTTVPGTAPPDEGEVSGRVRGRVRYLEQEVLPPEAVLVIRLIALDVEQNTDEVLAELERFNPGQVPIEFVLPFDIGEVDASDRHSLRAEITAGGKKLFMTTALFTVDLSVAGQADAGTILLTRVPR